MVTFVTFIVRTRHNKAKQEDYISHIVFRKMFGLPLQSVIFLIFLERISRQMDKNHRLNPSYIEISGKIPPTSMTLHCDM